MQNIQIELPTDWTDYELLDSGNGMKLERFGSGNQAYVAARPEPRAFWKPENPDAWMSAHATFERTSSTDGKWNITTPPPDPWIISHQTLKFLLKPTSFKHVGVFPEQAVNWKWLNNQIHGDALKVLNLFAYTGGATMAALSAGAAVTHVDSAKSTITWAAENIKLSGLSEKPVRWIEDDAFKFVLKEAKRGNTYDGIIMDPPRFGRGAKGEVWKIEDHLPGLLSAVKNILSDKPRFILINAYTSDFSSIALVQSLVDITKDLGGSVTFGELALTQTNSHRVLPSGIFARWSNT